MARSGKRKKPEELRSYQWYGVNDLHGFGHRSRTKQMGYAKEDFAGKPVIAVINTWSEINQCHSHFKQRAEEVKRGVWQAGGFPVELPAMSLSEPFVKPSTMLYRNMLAMESEELLRSHPMDGAVLMGGCDKTTPALLMAAASMNIPAVFLPAGPMLRGNWHGNTLGSGTDTWKYWAELRAGTITQDDWEEIEGGIARSPGHCMTMGTASTMTSVAEALGMTMPGAASIPAADSNHPRMATASGRRIVEMVWQDLKPRDIMSLKAIENAIVTVMTLGGSTNAAIHILAIAARNGHEIDLELLDKLSRTTPVLADLRPSGRFLMEDFYYAGGLRGLLNRLRDHLHLDCVTANGKTLGENLDGAEVFNDEVIRPLSKPLSDEGGLVVLRGNLAPGGAVIKHTAADPRFHKHAGPAVVFDSHMDLLKRIDDESLNVTADSVLVMKNAGPVGGPGMPEWGMLPIPKKLLQQGVRDMVRISDARMSGTSYGTCVLHVAPEAFVGGPLALVQDGDMIELDIFGRTLDLKVSEAELAERRKRWKAPKPHYPRGYGWMFTQHIEQADKGCDFDFLRSAEAMPEPEVH
ncbi:MAG: dihydroxy-acid dehydratase [Alphaproteobacteria bacterium]|nr:dihydroxy-acid dehydratase [Alphaproteobacteria bacterium]